MKFKDNEKVLFSYLSPLPWVQLWMCLKVLTICILPERVISKNNNPEMWKWLSCCSDLLMECYDSRLYKDGMSQLEYQKMSYMFSKMEWHHLVLTPLQFFPVACPSSTTILLGTQKRNLFPVIKQNWCCFLSLIPWFCIEQVSHLFHMGSFQVLEMSYHLSVFFSSQL